MKTTLIGLGVIVIVGGATYALVPRMVLKDYFQTGDKPTQQQFADTIDSAVNYQDDRDLTELKETPKESTAGSAVAKPQQASGTKVLKETDKEFKLDTNQSVTFRWTAVVPKPKEPVTYRLKVWQLMQGQSGAQAMRSNEPIVTKEVMNSAEVTVSGIYTGPCKPPYLCEFIWSVESISAAQISPTPPASGATVSPSVPTSSDSPPTSGGTVSSTQASVVSGTQTVPQSGTTYMGDSMGRITISGTAPNSNAVRFIIVPNTYTGAQDYNSASDVATTMNIVPLPVSSGKWAADIELRAGTYIVLIYDDVSYKWISSGIVKVVIM